MAKRVVNKTEKIATSRPALSLEARENQLIAKAVKLAEKQLEEGTASSQVICHYLKLGTAKERLELEKLEKENQLLIAKKEAYESSGELKQLFEDAMKAFKSYSGNEQEEAFEDKDV